MASSAELVVSGYIRELQCKLDILIPSDILIIFIMFYPHCIGFDGSTVSLTLKEKEMITSWFIKIFDLEEQSSILTSKLLYDYNKHGKSGMDFHAKCDGHYRTFTIVESEFDGHIFGCFLSKELHESEPESSGRYINDNRAFLCVIRSCFNNKGPELYQIKQSRYAYYNKATYGPSIGVDDLNLLSDGWNVSDGGCCHHRFNNFGDNKPDGNIICGGLAFNANNVAYHFGIKQMNTFAIQIDEFASP